MKEKFVLTLLTLICTGFLMPLNAVDLMIMQQSGKLVCFDLDEQPQVTFTKDDLVITTAASTNSVPLATVKQIYYEGLTGIEDAVAAAVHVSQSGNVVAITGLNPGEQVAVYGIDGKVLTSLRADGDGGLSLSLADMAKGVYIIKTGQLTFKTLKR